MKPCDIHNVILYVGCEVDDEVKGCQSSNLGGRHFHPLGDATASLPFLRLQQLFTATANQYPCLLTRYLLKAGLNVAQGKSLEPTVAYLAYAKDGTFQYHGDVDISSLLKALQYKSARCVRSRQLLCNVLSLLVQVLFWDVFCYFCC